jgi:hypothetical protein
VQSVTKVKPIRMSLDISTTVEPSQFRHGEGCQDGTRANPVKSGRGPNDRSGNGVRPLGAIDFEC